MKFLLTLILSVILATTALGQQNKFELGVEGGPSRIDISSKPNPHDSLYKPTIGFSTGFFFQYYFTKIFSLRTNIAYEKKGEAFSQTGILIDRYGRDSIAFKSKGNLNYHYVIIPTLIRVTFGKKIKYFINAGPYFGYLLNMTSKFRVNDKLIRAEDYTRSFKRFDTGISAGLGIIVPLKDNFFISCEIRNNLGLYDISNFQNLPNYSIKTNSTNLLVGIGYKLK